MNALRPGAPAWPVRSGFSIAPPLRGVITFSVSVSEYLLMRTNRAPRLLALIIKRRIRKRVRLQACSKLISASTREKTSSRPEKTAITHRHPISQMPEPSPLPPLSCSRPFSFSPPVNPTRTESSSRADPTPRLSQSRPFATRDRG
jgi:hypothetical protein